MSTGHETFVIKSGGRPAGDPSKYDFSTIQSLLDATDPGKVSAAGAAYNSAARIAAEVAHQLYLVGTDLGTKWEGTDARAAITALGQLYTTANELYWRNQQAGTALQTYGAALPQYKGLQWPAGGASPVEDPARQQAAEKVMRAVNQHIGNAWDTMPDKVQQNLPGLGSHTDNRPYAPGSSGPGTSGGPSGATGAGGGSGRVALPHLPSGADPGGGHGTELAGFPPMSGGPAGPPPSAGNSFPYGMPGGAPSFPGGGPGQSGMPLSYPGGGFVPGSLRSGAPGGIPDEEPMPSGGPPGNAAAANASAAEEAEAAQAERLGMGGQMGAPAGGGNSGMERWRESWRAEERQTWDSEEGVPEVLGGSPAAAHPDRDDAERERTTWLAGESEIWTGDRTALAGTIGDATSRFDEAEVQDIPEKEIDILDPEQLQELLDALVPDEESDDATPDTPSASGGFFNGDLVDEENTISRLLNG